MEYILISSKYKHNQESLDSWMNQYLLSKTSFNDYENKVYFHWFNPLNKIDECIKKEYTNRFDYKNNENFHALYNKLTKEILIIITNRYHIYFKCDKIPIGVVKTIQNYYPNIRLFCCNKDFEEVEI